ncbi:MAG TPA: hypothetical protein VEV39_13160 [Gemmatimonadales bacterium]|nr:hypothetical protein [Gemmatimonadales bacterium]
MNASLRRFMLTAGFAALVAAPAVAQNSAPAAPQVAVGGVVYAQYFYQLKDTAAHFNAFDVTRAYLNVIGHFSGGITTRVTADIAHSAAVGASQTFRLKYAYAGWNPEGSDLTYKLGLFQTPWLDWEEALWDYRMEGATVFDRAGYLASSDFGIGADGNINKEQVDFQAGIFDNGSYSTGLGDQRKNIQARLSVRAMNTDDASRVGGLRVTAFALVGKPVTGGTQSRFLGMVSYKSKTLTLAAEGGVTDDSLSASAAPTKGQVISAFGVYHFTDSPVALIARFDNIKPNKAALSTVPGFTNTRLIAGVSYQLTTNVRLLGDVDLLSYKNGSPTPAAEAARELAQFQAQFTF